VWQRDGDSYLRKTADIVRAANQEGLIVVIAAFEDTRSGVPAATGLPSAAILNFWRAWATFFKNTPLVIFDLFNEPSPLNIPAHVANQRGPGEWDIWRNGGALGGGRTAVGMQTLVDAVRASGASQI